jgi:hypothetical protein
VTVAFASASDARPTTSFSIEDHMARRPEQPPVHSPGQPTGSETLAPQTRPSGRATEGSLGEPAAIAAFGAGLAALLAVNRRRLTVKRAHPVD